MKEIIEKLLNSETVLEGIEDMQNIINSLEEDKKKLLKLNSELIISQTKNIPAENLEEEKRDFDNLFLKHFEGEK